MYFLIRGSRVSSTASLLSPGEVIAHLSWLLYNQEVNKKLADTDHDVLTEPM